MGLFDRLMEAGAAVASTLAGRMQNWNFSVLGSVYLGPGHFLRLPPVQFMAVLFGGFIWVALVGTAAWFLFHPRFAKSIKKGDYSSARILFSAFAFVYLLLGAYTTFSYPPTTDEPHYLALTESLVSGSGVEVSRVYARKDFMKFYPSDTIDPHTVITREGEMYSQHTIGMPALIAPGYALAGRWGTTATTALLAAFLVALFFLLGRKTGNGIRESARAAVLTGSTAPVLFASGTVFTEIPAALLSALSLLALGRGWTAPVCGALMPWLHPRYALLAVGLAVLDLGASRKKSGTIGKWLLAGAVSGVCFVAVYHGPALIAILNVLTEKYPARLDDLTAGNLAVVSFGNPLSGVLAKLFDRDFGWFPFSIWALVLIPGVVLAVGKSKYSHRWFLVGAGTYFLLTCLFRNWSGSAYPGRTLIPILPFIIGYLGLGIGWAGKVKNREKVFIWLVSISLLVSWLLTAVPVLRYGSGREWIKGKMGAVWWANPLSWFPSFLAPGNLALVVSALILAGGMAWIIKGNRGKR